MSEVQRKYWSMESNAIADHMMQAIDAITDLMSVPAEPDPDDWREAKANEQDKADEAAS